MSSRVLVNSLALFVLVMLGCSSDFSLLAEDIPGGMLLSAWSNGAEALIVGGQLQGGPGVLVHYEDGSLCVEEEAADKALWWIHGVSEGEWYAVGEDGAILHSHDGQRSREDVATESTLYGVWVTEDVVWAVGGNYSANPPVGEIWQRQDGQWSLFAGDLPGVVFKVWQGWFVGDGVAWHLEDGQLVDQELGDQRLLTARGRSDDDVWAVGGWGAAEVMHYDGMTWQEVDASELAQPLNGVWTSSGEDVWIAGLNGVVAAWREDSWLRPEAMLSLEHFHAAWKHQDEVLFVGGNMFATSDQHGVIVRYGPGRGEVGVSSCP